MTKSIDDCSFRSSSDSFAYLHQYGALIPREVNLALRLRDAFPSSVRSCQALTFDPALAYGLDNNRISGVIFVGVGNRGLSGIVYGIKVACRRSKQRRHNTWGRGLGKIADPKFHSGRIEKQTPMSNEKPNAINSSKLATMQISDLGYLNGRLA